jgi:hypothetical protein
VVISHGKGGIAQVCILYGKRFWPWFRFELGNRFWAWFRFELGNRFWAGFRFAPSPEAPGLHPEEGERGDE